MATLATDKQLSFMRKLGIERDASDLVEAAIKNGLTKQVASKRITQLLALPIVKAKAVNPHVQRGGLGTPAPDQPKVVDPDLTPGVYDVDGAVYVVKFNQGKTRLYAKHIVESPERLNANGDLIDIDFVYAPGAIFKIKPTHRMAFEDAKVLTIRYGRCINCGRALKAGKSVEAGIGPVCRKLFA